MQFFPMKFMQFYVTFQSTSTKQKDDMIFFFLLQE